MDRVKRGLINHYGPENHCVEVIRGHVASGTITIEEANFLITELDLLRSACKKMAIKNIERLPVEMAQDICEYIDPKELPQ